MAQVPEDIQNAMADQNISTEIKAAYDEILSQAVAQINAGEPVDIQAKLNVLTSVSENSITEFQTLSQRISEFTATDSDIQRYNTLLTELGNAADQTGVDFTTLAGAGRSSASELQKAAAETNALKTSMLDAAKSISDYYNEYKDLRSDLQDIGEMEKVVEVLNSGVKSGTEYTRALEYVADAYGVSTEQAAGMAAQLEEEINIKATPHSGEVRQGVVK